MTEAEWLRCRDAELMFQALTDAPTPRQALLLACAGARRYWDILPTRPSREWVSAAEARLDRGCWALDLIPGRT